MTHRFVPSHAPQGSLLLWIVAQFYTAWLAHRKSIGKPVSKLIIREFERFFRCGDPAYGYAVMGCACCGFTLGVAASCKGSAWCPYCLSRRQTKLTAQLVDGIFGSLPVRHWVFCLPPLLRYTLGYEPGALTATVNAFAKAVLRYLRRKAKRELNLKSVSLAHPGLISFVHRCSANVDTNVHFHGLAPDGVFVQRVPGGPVEFCALTPPSDEDIELVALDAARHVCSALERMGFWRWTGDASSTTMEGVLTFGGKKAQSAKFFPQAARHAEGGTAPRDRAYAFHLNADHLVEAGDRRALVELVQYVLAPPLADSQLSFVDGHVVIDMKRARHDGKGREVIEPFKFLDRLAALVTRPRSNAIRYHGVYGSNARLRKLVVPWSAAASPAPNDDSQDIEPDVVAQAHALFQAKHHQPKRTTCPDCELRLVLVEVVTPRFTYRKPGWDPPSVAHSSGFKTGSNATFIQ
jgi:hypothetical protein